MRRPSNTLTAAARRFAPGLAVASMLASLGWLAWNGAETRDAHRAAALQAVRVAELRGKVVHLDEWLTMSARMAAATGEARWSARYDAAEPLLDAALAEAEALATPQAARDLARDTEHANRRLVEMERAAFDLVAGGDRRAAAALLDSDEYARLKSAYADGLAAFSRELESLAASRAAALDRRAWMEAASLASGLLVLVAAVLVAAVVARKGRSRLSAALARTEAVARTDALTDLPNRRRFYEALGAALQRSRQDGAAVAVLLLDLDRFKAVNDLHGHPAGDRLLQLAAARLRAAARSADLVARLGGDEFAVVAPIGIEPGAAAAGGKPTTEDAARLARRVVAALEEPFELPGGALALVGTSVGIALAPTDGGDPDALVRCADAALYRAKAAGRNGFRFFEPGMDSTTRERTSLEMDLRQAVADDALIPYFQPLVDLAGGRIVSYEMLARWPHPTRGMVQPLEFIPVAEDIGLIGALTERLLRRACRVAASWPDDVSLACNVSPTQLRDRSLPELVRSALVESGLPPHRLELELTESALVDDLGLAREILAELKALGVRLSLDDFGTGYSSLRHLQTLPFDKIKIDSGFVRAMADDPESRKIVAAVVGLGHSLGLPTVAEGVETAAAAALLRGLGCDVGQGWLFGRPAAAIAEPVPAAAGAA